VPHLPYSLLWENIDALLCMIRHIPGHAFRSRPPSAKSFGTSADRQVSRGVRSGWCARHHDMNIPSPLSAVVDNLWSLALSSIMRGNGAGTQSTIISSKPA